MEHLNIQGNIVVKNDTVTKEDFRISNTTGALMIGTAVFFDATQALLDLIPFLGWILAGILGVIAFLFFFVWTSFYGIGFIDKRLTGILKKLVVRFLGPILEVFLSFLPWITIGVVLTLLVVRADDKATQKNILTAETRERLEKVLRSKRGSRTHVAKDMAREELRDIMERRRARRMARQEEEARLQEEFAA